MSLDATPSDVNPMLDATPLEPAPAPPAPPPAAEPPAPPVDAKGPSWDEVVAQLPPEQAEHVKRLRSNQDAAHNRALDEARAKASPPVAVPPELPVLLRRMSGMEEGDPFEGIDVPAVAAPDFKALVGDGEALTDPAKLAELLDTVYSRAREDAETRARNLMVKLTEETYRPVREQAAKAEVARVVEEATTRLRRLPGMRNEDQFDEVIVEMNRRGIVGEDGFRAVYSELLPDRPHWYETPAPVAPAASATPAPVPTVVRPAPKEDTFAAGRALSAALNPSTAPTRSATVVPRNAGPAAQAMALARDPGVRDAIARDDGRPSWQRVAEATKKARGS